MPPLKKVIAAETSSCAMSPNSRPSQCVVTEREPGQRQRRADVRDGMQRAAQHAIPARVRVREEQNRRHERASATTRGTDRALRR